MADQNSFLIYQDDNGVSNVKVRFEGEDVWLAAEQIQVLFQASRQDVAYHIEQIYADGELQQSATCKKFLQVRQEGSRSVKRNFAHYNLDMILAIGMRIRSDMATRFRQWAIRHLPPRNDPVRERLRPRRARTHGGRRARRWLNSANGHRAGEVKQGRKRGTHEEERR